MSELPNLIEECVLLQFLGCHFENVVFSPNECTQPSISASQSKFSHKQEELKMRINALEGEMETWKNRMETSEDFASTELANNNLKRLKEQKILSTKYLLNNSLLVHK